MSDRGMMTPEELDTIGYGVDDMKARSPGDQCHTCERLLDHAEKAGEKIVRLQERGAKLREATLLARHNLRWMVGSGKPMRRNTMLATIEEIDKALANDAGKDGGEC